jgi:hypothetical protein
MEVCDVRGPPLRNCSWRFRGRHGLRRLYQMEYELENVRKEDCWPSLDRCASFVRGVLQDVEINLSEGCGSFVPCTELNEMQTSMVEIREK